MALPFSGRISASDINIEAQRVSTTRAPLGGTAGEVSATENSLTYLYSAAELCLTNPCISSPVNQYPAYAYSEFYGKTWRTPPTPYFVVQSMTSNYCSPPGISVHMGKYYAIVLEPNGYIAKPQGANVNCNWNTDQQASTWASDNIGTGATPWRYDSANGSGVIAYNNAESDYLLIGCSLYTADDDDDDKDHKPTIFTFWPPATSSFTDTPAQNGIAYDYVNPNHWISDMHYIDGFQSGTVSEDDLNYVFWCDQEWSATDSSSRPGYSNNRRYGVFSTGRYTNITAPAIPNPIQVDFRPFYQFPNFTRKIESNDYRQGYRYSAPKCVSINSSYYDATGLADEAYIYVVSQTYNTAIANNNKYMGGIVRLTYTFETPLSSFSVFNDSSIVWKLWNNNTGVSSGGGFKNDNSDFTTFTDVCVAKTIQEPL
jgi:hypothetical protein